MANEKTVEFLNLYNHLESVLREEYPQIPRGVRPIKWATQNDRRRFGAMREELDYCREVRNLVQHNEKVDGSYAVIPSDAMLETLRRTLEKVENPPRAFDVCVKTQNVYSARITDLVRPAMKKMVEGSFTHIPILEEGRVIGAFSENTLLSYMMRDEIAIIEEDCTFEAFSSLIPLAAHESETFAFVGREERATSVAVLFENSMRNQERLGMVFITATGDPNQKLLGILTVWDMARFI